MHNVSRWSSLYTSYSDVQLLGFSPGLHLPGGFSGRAVDDCLCDLFLRRNLLPGQYQSRRSQIVSLPKFSCSSARY